MFLCLTALSMLLAVAPPQFWMTLWRHHKIEIAIATGYSAVVLLFANAVQRTWEPLSGITFYVSGLALHLIDPAVEIEPDYKEIHFRDFSVQIAPDCSGYEGIGLILAFLAIFLYTMRANLRFPVAFMLLPIGVSAIFLLNIVRIVVLVCIGAYISPDIAVEGFHSHAGWVAFLAVTVGIMWIASNSPTFSKIAETTRPDTAVSQSDPIIIYLAPFMALLTANILSSLAVPYGHVFYPLVPVLIGLALWSYRSAYASMLSRVSPISIVVGLVVGVLWVATAKAPAENTVAVWLGSLPAIVVVGWILMRGIGTMVLVPIAEELAFRGYLHRALQARDWYNIPVGRFSIVAFLVTSAAFGLMHQRWVAGALAGAVFALLMYRSNRISDPIAAHMTANATIFFFAIATARWDVI